ncbi:hypothetical protein FHS43_000549 [Streptosporangium becharense]|uniref:Uncharacterized protein n=1 Tax=Streptosporangium becharense TaxID=1816182 RepID=A0A7W9IPH5_9ACTN|nr:hypothetical protein [Streptosporangium becharense]MBB2909303.1 hypothetical protein [Streptosporangium becharense]MBB5823794.1 hypothetical protein [Streptosporangium becharense]
MTDRPAPPAPAPAEPCAYGCRPATGWRWTPAGWVRACDTHRRGGRRGAFVPDITNTTRTLDRQ